jgi:hypothetical protein
MGRGRRGGEAAGWKGVECCAGKRGRGVEGAGVRPCPTRTPCVALASDEPGPLAVRAGPDSARCPALGIAALPPLALGGMGGDALN